MGRVLSPPDNVEFDRFEKFSHSENEEGKKRSSSGDERRVKIDRIAMRGLWSCLEDMSHSGAAAPHEDVVSS